MSKNTYAMFVASVLHLRAHVPTLTLLVVCHTFTSILRLIKSIHLDTDILIVFVI